MSQQLIQKQIVASDILRTCGKKFKQIRGRYTDDENGRCVFGVLMDYHNRSLGWVCNRFGIDRDLYTRMIDMNDEGKTFDEIADYLESHGF